MELTEHDLQVYQKSQRSWHEEAYREMAVATARIKKIFNETEHDWPVESSNIGMAVGGDLANLDSWLNNMATDAAQQTE